MRATWLLVSEVALLDSWCADVYDMFDEVPYLVGSSVYGPGWRDVDIRVMLDPADFAVLSAHVDIGKLNLTVSLWGQRVTGLPIDFQVQDRDVANVEYGGRRRHPRGLRLRRRHPSRG